MNTNFIPFKRMLDRINVSREDSDAIYFYDLMLLGEIVVKTVVSGMIASIQEEPTRNKYRLLHKTVRANGIGEWSAVLDEMLTGVAAQYIFPTVRQKEQQELSAKTGNEAWQYKAVDLLNEALSLVSNSEKKAPSPNKIQGKTWFSTFATLRNATKGHGASLPSNCSAAATPLEESIKLIVENYYLFQREWVYLYQSISGKYRVSKMNSSTIEFDALRSDSSQYSKYVNGIYVFFSERTHIELITSSPELDDFYFPNGNFREKSFELLSYVTDSRKDGDSSKYLVPASELPPSETEGLSELEVVGNCFSNMPPASNKYVSRTHLEDELWKVLNEKDRYPIVTLKGIGGIGKTSLALSILHRISNEDRFSVILWFSSRDIDLTADGAKHVKNKILSEEDVALDFANFIGKGHINRQDKLSLLSKEMSDSSNGPMLFVFDNFETVKNPAELFTWIDTYIRHPNKVLITSRTSKSFKADYPIEVAGMTSEECEKLIQRTADEFSITHLLSRKDVEKIIHESSGHPYVIKIFLGEISKNQKVNEIKRIVAGKDDILTALFRRTYAWLSPAAKRIFLTLCSWRSIIPQIALEAVLLREENERLHVDDAVEELRQSSFIEVIYSENENEVFINVPLAASIFGKNELEVSPEKAAIMADRELLQDFGAAQQSDIPHGLSPRIERKFRTIALRVSQNKEKLEAHLPMLEYLASKFPDAWIHLANIHEENNDITKVQDSYREFLKTDADASTKQLIWQKLAGSYKSQGEWFKEVNALIEMCTLPGCSFNMMSDVANVVNNYFQNNKLAIDNDIKQKIIVKLVELMERNIGKTITATDYSRLAWLYLHLKNSDKANEVTQKGLLIDPNNDYCRKLAIRLEYVLS